MFRSWEKEDGPNLNFYNIGPSMGSSGLAKSPKTYNQWLIKGDWGGSGIKTPKSSTIPWGFEGHEHRRPQSIASQRRPILSSHRLLAFANVIKAPNRQKVLCLTHSPRTGSDLWAVHRTRQFSRYFGDRIINSSMSCRRLSSHTWLQRGPTSGMRALEPPRRHD